MIFSAGVSPQKTPPFTEVTLINFSSMGRIKHGHRPRSRHNPPPTPQAGKTPGSRKKAPEDDLLRYPSRDNHPVRIPPPHSRESKLIKPFPVPRASTVYGRPEYKNQMTHSSTR